MRVPEQDHKGGLAALGPHKHSSFLFAAVRWIIRARSTAATVLRTAAGDTATHWFRSQDACFEAITAEVFFHWASGQSDSPDNLPATATAAGLPHQDRKPYPGWTD